MPWEKKKEPCQKITKKQHTQKRKVKQQKKNKNEKN